MTTPTEPPPSPSRSDAPVDPDSLDIDPLDPPRAEPAAKAPPSPTNDPTGVARAGLLDDESGAKSTAHPVGEEQAAKNAENEPPA